MGGYGHSSNGGTVSTPSPDESTFDRRLADGEPAEPTECWIATADGGRIDCTLTREDQSTWIARPPAPHHVQEGDSFRIDRLPTGCRVVFDDVIGPGQEDWSGRAATRPAT